MIEIIYKNDSEKNNEDAVIKLPKNIRQVGDGNSDYQIYVEDNIMNYLKKVPEKENDIRYGVLLGNVKKGYGYTYIFVNAAIDVEDIVENTVIFSDEIWSGINDNIHRYFGDLKVVGWFTSLNYSVSNDMPYISRIHLDNFAGNDKIYLKLDRIEDEETFYVYGTGGLKKQPGYHIYYEKNNNMDDYIFGSNISSGFRTENVKKKQQTQTVPKTAETGKYGIEENLQKTNTLKFESVAKKVSRNIASILLMLMLAGTIALVSNEEAMSNLRARLQNFISGSEDGDENDIPVNGIINEPATSGQTDSNDNEEATGEENTTTADESEEQTTTGGVTVIEKVTTTEAPVNNQPEETTTEAPTKEVEAPTASVIANESNYYIVNTGDTLYSIAVKIYNDDAMVDDIMKVNNIENPDYVEVGDKLLLP
ncbi:MAG: LysM peptidoglycan-binding domain-containing protein [Lachnospiraceae bacterium]|nr:LysM peptidoglycan-binding domain-containing protein [Lachnospiraceae bacterium]